jgi:predicted TIM-barrel fold metal-dependent hydrolase
VNVSVTRGFLLAATVVLGACASSARVERAAVEHDRRAAELEARGDYTGALREREAADKQRAKAAWRAQHEYDVPPALKLP